MNIWKVTPAEDRLAMVTAAVEGVPGAEVSRIELDRGGPSYTVETVEELQAAVKYANDKERLIGLTAAPLAAAIAIVTDPATLGIAWSAAAAGWLLTQVIPLIVRAVLEATFLARAARLRAARGRLMEAWGLEQPPTS